MLESMRSLAHGFLAKTLLLFLVVTFVVWGIGDILRTSGASYLVKVGSSTISYPDFARNKDFLERSLEAMGMHGVDPRALENQVLRTMVEQKLMELDLKDIGLHVGDDVLVQKLKATQEFHDIQGNFSRQAFESILHQQQMSEGRFLDQLRTEITSHTLLDTIDVTDVKLPQSFLALAAKSAGETRDAFVITLAAANAPVGAISEDALKDYYDKHKDPLYREPEKRTLEYVTVSADDIKALAEKQITDTKLQERFTEEKSKFADTSFEKAKPKLREELRADAQENAVHDVSNAIEDAMAGGSSMGEAVANAGLKAQSRELKNVTQESFADSKDPLIHAVVMQGFTLGQGETSSLQTTQNGMYYLVGVSAVTPAAPKPYDSVKADVHARLSHQLQRDAVRDQAQKVKDTLTDSKDWHTAVNSQHLNGHEVSGIIRPTTKAASSGLPVPLQQAIFEHAQGQVAGPLTLENGDAMLAIVTGIHYKEQPVNDATRKQLATTMNQEIQMQYFTALAKRYPVTVNEKLFASMHQHDSAPGGGSDEQ